MRIEQSVQSQSALQEMCRAGLQREPSLSPNQHTFSYVGRQLVPRPSIGSDIEIDFPGARPSTFRPRLVDLWADDPTPPPHTAATVVDTGSVTGASPGRCCLRVRRDAWPPWPNQLLLTLVASRAWVGPVSRC